MKVQDLIELLQQEDPDAEVAKDTIYHEMGLDLSSEDWTNQEPVQGIERRMTGRRYVVLV